MKPRKHVWVVSDGIPGHFNQSKGVVMALARHYDCDVHWLDMTLRSGILRRLLRLLLNATRRPLPTGWLHFFYQHGELPLQQPDILVGAGGKVSFALAWLSRVVAAPAVFSGSLRGLEARNFALILSIEPRHAGPNILTLDVAPMPVDIVAQQKAGKELRQQLGLAGEQLWLLLAGGDGAGFRFTPEDWRKLAAEAGELAQQEGIRWLVSTSRRTGGEGDDILRAGLTELVVADAVWWSTQPRRILQAYLGAADVVCCTADSLSMLTEAVVSGRPVIAWQPASARPNADYQAALDRLVRRNLIVQAETLAQGATLLASRPAGTFDQQRLEARLIVLCEAAS